MRCTTDMAELAYSKMEAFRATTFRNMATNLLVVEDDSHR